MYSWFIVTFIVYRPMENHFYTIKPKVTVELCSPYLAKELEHHLIISMALWLIKDSMWPPLTKSLSW